MFEPRDYDFEVPFSGDATAALDAARSALLGHGFEIVDATPGELRAVGPGMSSTNQPALVGASELALVVGASAIKARARLGGVRKMQLFVYFFPPGLVLFLLLVFVLTGTVSDSGPSPWLWLLCIAPWIVIAPMTSSMMERRTTKAVDRLVRSMVQAVASRS